MTQEEIVLNHLKKEFGLTASEALKRYGIKNLSAVIYRLRKKNYYIFNGTLEDEDGKVSKQVYYQYLATTETQKSLAGIFKNMMIEELKSRKEKQR